MQYRAMRSTKPSRMRHDDCHHHRFTEPCKLRTPSYRAAGVPIRLLLDRGEAVVL